MSKTYNSKHKYLEGIDKTEYPNGYSRDGVNYNPGEISDHDVSYTTATDNRDPHIKATRHPNKKKHPTLGKGYNEVGLGNGIRYWRDRFGRVDRKSSRLKSYKRAMSHSRRHRTKISLRDVINDICIPK